ncbi:UNVERIFIED_CONTAM: Retrovirus-related Pol polyprotein from transposon TNT 1-94 [Sesamum latifolium]|uniref:Retrovirus-related Pol polyprotein from transposon TNT 1-94 n=1 Tax=Sesamum latifolium TaxID=2727402 RepID=A0AAW2SRG2_9LAMI
MIRLESSGSCEEARQNILGISWNENGLCLGQATSTALPEGSSPEERLTFDKWLEENHKVRSIILASMTNEMQKQYDMVEDVPSIMLHMKEVYVVPDRHIKYAAIKAFFGTKMAEGSFIQSHGVKMLSLVEQLEDFKAGLENDTYIDAILQSLPPSYDPFIVNYNMNGLEKSIHELINMLVQYEATTHKSEPTVLVGEASTSRQECQTLKEEEGGIGRGNVHNSSPTQVLERSRKLSKDEMVLRLGNGKAVAAKAVRSLSLVIRKDDQEALCWRKRDANGLLDLVHIDVCGPLSTPTRGGFSYFITFTDDHSRYGYVYLMRYKSEALGRFKEYRLKVENQTGRKIKALRLDQGGEYLSGEFIDYLKENGIISQCTPPGATT